MAEWSNWSGKVRADARRIVAATDEAHLQSLIAEAAERDEPVRVVGEGHSHSELVATDGTIVDVDALSGVIEVDPEAMEFRVGAGTRIHALGDPLREAGLALLNQGDIDRQSIAGAVATGTHGTGPSLQNFSAGVLGLRMVMADGSIVECDAERDAEVFRAARLGLGAFGIVTELRMRARPAYRLKERMWVEDVDRRAGRSAGGDPGDAPLRVLLAARQGQGRVQVSRRNRASPRCIRWGPKAAGSHGVTGCSPTSATTSTPRWSTRCRPRAASSAFAHLRALIEADFPELAWPVELRTLAADDVWMSTAFERETITLSVHQGADQPHEALFEACEGVFRDFHGRPHWGKVHGRRGDDLASLHPRWREWWAARDASDPARPLPERASRRAARRCLSAPYLARHDME